MKQRVAVKVLELGLSGYGYRRSTIERAAARMRPWMCHTKNGLTRRDAAAFTAAMMKQMGGSIHEVRFLLDGYRAKRRLEELA